MLCIFFGRAYSWIYVDDEEKKSNIVSKKKSKWNKQTERVREMKRDNYIVRSLTNGQIFFIYIFGEMGKHNIKVNENNKNKRMAHRT